MTKIGQHDLWLCFHEPAYGRCSLQSLDRAKMPPVYALEQRIRRLYHDRSWVEVSELPGQQAPLTPKHLAQTWDTYAKGKSHDRWDSGLYDIDRRTQKFGSCSVRRSG
jgi:hypothetical protein